MNHSRSMRVVAVLVALGAASSITMMSCEPDHNPDRPGPPKIISGYVLDANDATFANCDQTDPRAWGGNFQNRDTMGMLTPIRCVPDMLNSMDAGKMFSFNVQLRVVFSELLNGDKIEDQDNVKLTSKLHDGVVTATGPTGVATVPINNEALTTGTSTSYYDPGGADFKQGLYGTAPPGPSIIVTPGDGGLNLTGLPSGGISKVCFTVDQVIDTAGNHLSGDNCVSVATATFAVASTTPADGDMIDADTLIANGGLQVVFDAPVKNTDIQAGAWLEIRFGNMVVPSACYMVAEDPTSATSMTASTAAVITPVDMGACTIPRGMTIPVTLIVKGTLVEQYGVQLGSDSMTTFTLTPAPDAGAP